MTATARTRVRVPLAALIAVLLTACAAPTAPAPSAPPSADGAFPVTIEHRFGSTTIESRPQRVLSLGDDDIVYGLGVTPVGIANDYGFEAGVPPWLEGSLDPAATTVLEVVDSVSIEQVAALAPDLIVAIGWVFLDTDYEQLAQIAPVVGYETAWGEQTWQERTAVVGAALGESRRAQALVDETEAAITAVRDAHPGLAGRSVSLSYFFDQGVGAVVNSPDDVTVRLLGELGLVIPPTVAEIPGTGPDDPMGTLSYENVSLIEADLLLVLYADGLRDTVEGLRPFQALTAVREGRYFPIDEATGVAVRSPSALSIRYALDRLAPAWSVFD